MNERLIQLTSVDGLKTELRVGAAAVAHSYHRRKPYDDEIALVNHLVAEAAARGMTITPAMLGVTVEEAVVPPQAASSASDQLLIQ